MKSSIIVQKLVPAFYPFAQVNHNQKAALMIHRARRGTQRLTQIQPSVTEHHCCLHSLASHLFEGIVPHCFSIWTVLLDTKARAILWGFTLC